MISVKKAAAMAVVGLFLAALTVAAVIGVLQTYDGQNLESLTQENLAVKQDILAVRNENQTLMSRVEHLERRLSERNLKIEMLESSFDLD